MRPGKCAILVFTSGTTGNFSKGVMLSHDNLTFQPTIIAKMGQVYGHVVLSYLPLSHIASFCFDVLMPVKYCWQVYFPLRSAL